MLVYPRLSFARKLSPAQRLLFALNGIYLPPLTQVQNQILSGDLSMHGSTVERSAKNWFVPSKFFHFKITFDIRQLARLLPSSNMGGWG